MQLSSSARLCVCVYCTEYKGGAKKGCDQYDPSLSPLLLLPLPVATTAAAAAAEKPRINDMKWSDIQIAE